MGASYGIDIGILICACCLGPIVRIGPNEVHILDSSFYNTLYSNRNRFDKYDWFYSMLGNPEATFSTIRADVHKYRRGGLAPFFSAQSIARFNPRVQAYTDRLVKRMQDCAARGESIPLFFAYRCLTVDIISEYLFGSNLGLLDRADWGRDFYSAWRSLWEMSPLIRQLPFILKVFNAMPRWMLALTQPKALEVIDMQLLCDKLTTEVLASDPDEMAKKGQPTMLWEVAHDPNIPQSEKTLERLRIESNSVLAAGFETTGGTLAHMTYLILAHPESRQKLEKELKQAIPDPNNIPGFQTLEKLPYLWAVVKESLRYVKKRHGLKLMLIAVLAYPLVRIHGSHGSATVNPSVTRIGLFLLAVRLVCPLYMLKWTRKSSLIRMLSNRNAGLNLVRRSALNRTWQHSVKERECALLRTWLMQNFTLRLRLFFLDFRR